MAAIYRPISSQDAIKRRFNRISQNEIEKPFNFIRFADLRRGELKVLNCWKNLGQGTYKFIISRTLARGTQFALYNMLTSKLNSSDD